MGLISAFGAGGVIDRTTGSGGRIMVVCAVGRMMPETASLGGVMPLVATRTGAAGAEGAAGLREVMPEGALAGTRELTASRRADSATQGSVNTRAIAAGRSIGKVCPGLATKETQNLRDVWDGEVAR